MSFESLLKRKLGPMGSLMHRPRRSAPAEYDPAELYYRRAVGLEVRARPEETWGHVEIGRLESESGRHHRLKMKDAEVVLGLTEWRTAEALRDAFGIGAKRLMRWVEEDLLFFSRTDPGVSLAGQAGVLGDDASEGAIGRRASMWPTVAVETADRIAPMPFMPRGRALAGAEMIGLRFASLERGFEVLGATITGSARTGGQLRALLPLLDGRRPASEILEHFPERSRDSVRKLLELLDRLTVLEPVPTRSAVAATLARPGVAQVTWLGHAAVLIQSRQHSILVDPLFFSSSEPPAPHDARARFDPRDLPDIDAVFITHADNDHLNPNSLAHLPVDTPIYFPAMPADLPPHQVDMRGMLRVLAFENVYELPVGSRVRIGDLTITACPFEGECWDLDLAQLTYLVQGPELSVFCSADAYRMDELYGDLGRNEERIDLALMGVSGCAESYVMPPGLGYGNFYEAWIPPARRNEWVQHCAGPADAVHSLSLFNPRFAFGYASGGAPYIRTEYSDRGDHVEMAARLQEARAGDPDLDTRPVSLPLGRPVTRSDLEDLGAPIQSDRLPAHISP